MAIVSIDIPDDMLLKNIDDPIATIVENINMLFGSTVSDTTYFRQRSIARIAYTRIFKLNLMF